MPEVESKRRDVDRMRESTHHGVPLSPTKSVGDSGKLDKDETWPPYETMAIWLDEEQETNADPSLDLPIPEVS